MALMYKGKRIQENFNRTMWRAIQDSKTGANATRWYHDLACLYSDIDRGNARFSFTVLE